MNANSPQCALFLYPRQKNFLPDNFTTFIKVLQNISLIDQPINDKENCYYIGEQYLDYIAYLGCSPTIQFEESKTSDKFCHIKIHTYDIAKLLVNKVQARAPHCPVCNKPVKDWQTNISNESIHCKLCHSNSHLSDYNWRKSAGYAQLFIEITDIFPKEAVPQQILLDQLAKEFHTEWDYFYRCLD